MIPKSMILILLKFPKLYNEPSFANIYGPGRKIDKSLCGRKRLHGETYMDFTIVGEMLPCDFYEITYGVYFGNSFIFAFFGKCCVFVYLFVIFCLCPFLHSN